jgi:lipoprotein-anchoring transpeptidase ErfK/SrfK
MLMNFAAAALLLMTHVQSNSSRSSNPPISQPVTAVVGPVEQEDVQPAQLVSQATSSVTAIAAEAPASPSPTPSLATLRQRQAASPLPQAKPDVPALSSMSVAQAISPIRLVVDLSDRTVYLYQRNTVDASYPVSIGKPGWETPTGTFQINHMEANPVWQHPITKQTIPAGPGNPLGSRWIGFATTQHYEIGFHGTDQPATVGQAISHGCLRMHEADIQKLYAQVHVGTPVVVRP